MAVLCDSDINKIINEEGAVEVEDGPELDIDEQVGPSSIDLRLGYEFGFLETRKVEALDTRSMEGMELKKELTAGSDEGVVVHPGEFVLSTTLETVDVPDDMVARVEGRSSYARLGLIPHAAGGFVDAGFRGQITLEIQNLGNVPIRIYPEDRICQLAFEMMTGEAGTPYGDRDSSKYMAQEGATASRLERE
jgi:dCTP deaminase